MKRKSRNAYMIHRRRRVPKSATKPTIKVTVDIRPGLAASSAAKQQWKRFWAKLISQVKDEGKGG